MAVSLLGDTAYLYQPTTAERLGNSMAVKKGTAKPDVAVYANENNKTNTSAETVETKPIISSHPNGFVHQGELLAKLQEFDDRIAKLEGGNDASEPALAPE